MSSRSTGAAALEDRRLPVQARLAAAWASFMFFYIYVDYLALYKPGFLDEIGGGTVHGFDTGPLFVGASLTLVGIPALMVALSATLPARINRPLNLVIAVLYVPVTIFNGSGESMSYAYFYGFSIAVESLLLLFVMRTAWTWPRVAAPAPGTVQDDARIMSGR